MEDRQQADGQHTHDLVGGRGASYGLANSILRSATKSHIGNAGRLFDSIFSAIAKRKYGLLLVIANAGFRDHWAWELREAVRQDAAWYFHRLEGPVASWISPKHFEEQQRILLPEEYKRLWLNDWASTCGDSLDPRDIQACTTLTGPRIHVRTGFILRFGFGRYRDHSAVVVLAADPRSGMVEVAAVQSWNPADNPDGKVDLIEVRYVVKTLYSLYQFVASNTHFWQAEQGRSNLLRKRVPVSRVEMQQGDLNVMTKSLLDAFSNRRIALPAPGADARLIEASDAIDTEGLQVDGDQGRIGSRARTERWQCVSRSPLQWGAATQYLRPEPQPEQLYA